MKTVVVLSKWWVALLVPLLVPVTLAGQAAVQANWVGSWASSQQLPEPQNSLSSEDLRDATLRQIVHLSVGGSELRVHVSNAFGTAPLNLTAVHVARPSAAGGAAIDPATDKALTFGGTPDVTVPAGAEYISDPVAFSIGALSDLVITLHMDAAPASQTGHPGSRATSYVAHGDLVSAANLPGAKTGEHWYQVSGVDVRLAGPVASVVTLGDSLTDGHGATTNGNDRWPDVLARQLQSMPKTRGVGVLNAGIGGNRLLLDGLGPNALARFDRDVLASAGVRYLIVLEGVNDLGTLTRDGEVAQAEHDALVRRILSAYEQIAERAHAHGIKVIGATILPYGGSAYYHPGPANEADRQAINQWIRQSKSFDAVVDFDKVMLDPLHPDKLSPAYDSGDHLHPSPAGYRVMGEAIPLGLFSN
jgi:lysophospholipase L1-like esterase